jgi:hypothetical protein
MGTKKNEETSGSTPEQMMNVLIEVTRQNGVALERNGVALENLAHAVRKTAGKSLDKDAAKGVVSRHCAGAQDYDELDAALWAAQLESAKDEGYLATANAYRRRHQTGFIAGVAVALGGAYALGRLDLSARGEDDLDMDVGGSGFRVVNG